MSIKLPKIHLDSGDPEETKKVKGLLGTLDGQTTNPSLVAKNPEIQKYIASGKKLTEKELLDMYKSFIGEIGKQIAGPISVETYADWKTSAKDLLVQAEDMMTWGRNIYVKFPTIPEGVKAAHELIEKGGRVNMTLVFDQNQSAAVYTATTNILAKTGQPAFLSPFMGRWDDRGYRGVDLLKNIIKMYKAFDKKRDIKKPHVLVLAASIRSLDHFYTAIFMGADILTVPYKIIAEWVQQEKWMPDEHYRSEITGLKPIVYDDIQLNNDFKSYAIADVEGSLLSEGLTRFVKDWKSLIK